MKTHGCQNGIMLDCGGSSQGYALGQYEQGEKRKVSYWICIWVSKSTSNAPKRSKQCPYSEPVGTVKIGANGDTVRWVQWHLRESIFPDLPVDGVFYSKTRIAVITFQKQYGLAADGIVGAQTRAKLKAVVQ